jgi:hypothetical protein
MQLSNATQKINLHTNAAFGPVLSPGAQTYFVDMVFIYGQWHVRTEFDHNNNNFVGIPVGDIGDIPITSITPRWISVESAGTKYDPLRRTTLGPIQAQSAAKVVSSITVNGVEYLRTEFDDAANRNHFIQTSEVTDVRFFDFIQPRILASAKSAQKIDITSGSVVASTPSKTLLTFDDKLIVGGEQYIQTTADDGTTHAYRFKDFVEATADTESYFVPLSTPRWMQLESNTTKRQVLSPSQTFGPSLAAEQQAFFPDMVQVDGMWYARTQFDKINGNLHAIPATDLTEVPISPIASVWMSIPNTTLKVDPVRNTSFELVSGGSAAQFVDSISIDGRVYLRTAFEQGADRPRFIAAGDLIGFDFFDFIQPRQMTTRSNVNKVNVQTGVVDSVVPVSTSLFYNKRITVGGVLYAQTQADNGTALAVRASSLQ